MRYALVNEADEVVNVIELEPGADYAPPQGCRLEANRDFLPAPPPEIARSVTVVDGTAFLARVADTEYIAITKSSNVQVQRWIELLRLRGEIDVSGETAVQAQAGLVALGLLTKDRADVIFAPPA